MNNPYKLTIIYLTRIPRSPKGFALAFCLAIGVVMALTGAAMMIRGQGQQTKVLAQKAKAQGVSTAGVAVTQIQQLLSQNKFLAEYDSSKWADVADDKKKDTDIYKDFAQASKSCDIQNSSDSVTTLAARIASFGNRTSQQINPDDPTQGKYKLISYTAPTQIPGLGKLIVQGVANATGNDNNVKEASSQVVVEIPVNKNQLDDRDTPGLWLKEGGLNSNLFAAHVWMGDCTLGGKTTQAAVDTAMTAIKSQVVEGTAEAIKDKELTSGTSFQDPIQVTYNFPDLPTIPNALQNDAGYASQRGITVGGTTGTTTATAKTIGTTTCGTNNGTGNNFPRATDLPTKTETVGTTTICVFEYIVNSITGSGIVNTVSIDNKRQKVIFHLQGNLSLSGNESVDHQCRNTSADLCKATDFQLFGRANTGTPTICFNGNGGIDAFIFAPNYIVGVKGSGNGKGGINGTLWAKSWGNCTSETKSGAVVVQTGKWSELGVGIPKGMPDVTLSTPSSYDTQEYTP